MEINTIFIYAPILRLLIDISYVTKGMWIPLPVLLLRKETRPLEIALAMKLWPLMSILLSSTQYSCYLQSNPFTYMNSNDQI